MRQWSSAKAKRVLAALQRIGWSINRESSSHKILCRPGWPDVVFAFHDKDEIGPKMLGEYARAGSMFFKVDHSSSQRVIGTFLVMAKSLTIELGVF